MEEQRTIWENLLYREKKSWLLAALFGILFSAAQVLGASLEKYGSIPVTDKSMWVRVLFLSMIITIFTVALWSFLESFQDRRRDAIETGRKYHSLFGWWDRLSVNTQNLLLWLILMAFYLIVLLAVYPGFFVYDAQDELVMVETRHFTTHHPLFHVLLLGGIVKGVEHLTGSYNLGIFIYSLLQMAVMAATIVYMLQYLCRKGIRRWIRLAAVAFFALCPTIVMFVLCTAKDSFFTALLMLTTISVLEYFADPEVFWSSRRRRMTLYLSALGMMLFRHNGVYALLVFMPFLFYWSKGQRRRMLRLWAGIFISFFVINGLLTFSLQASHEENQEMLTVPIQQLARTYIYDGDSFTEEEEEAMLALMPKEDWKRYTPKLSDPVKVHFNNSVFAANKGKYVSLWIRKGLRHPMTYLNAWFMTSYGYWYNGAVLDCYRGNTVFTFTYKDSSYFGYETEQPGERHSLIPWLNELYREFSLETWPQKLPVVRLFFSPGVMFWLMIFSLFYCIDRKNYVPCKALLPVFLVWLTVLLGPCTLVRYVVILWFLAPLFLAFLFNEERFRV